MRHSVASFGFRGIYYKCFYIRCWKWSSSETGYWNSLAQMNKASKCLSRSASRVWNLGPTLSSRQSSAFAWKSTYLENFKHLPVLYFFSRGFDTPLVSPNSVLFQSPLSRTSPKWCFLKRCCQLRTPWIFCKFVRLQRVRFYS